MKFFSIAILFNQKFRNLINSSILSTILIAQSGFNQALRAETSTYCRFTKEAISAKQNLLQSSLKGNADAEKQYKALIKKHADLLRQCRLKTWPQNQAIWLRLYPCDARSGVLDYLLDRIVNLGYNQIYLEVFYDGQVLLPPADNPTPWASVTRNVKGAERIDLLAQTIEKSHQRGLKVYAWAYTMNFGYTYSQRSDRQTVLARNGQGQDSTSFVEDGSQAFVDPYNRQAQVDYYRMLSAILKRKPDGFLFDYIRYPRGTGERSAVGQVKDLWIYSSSSLKALYSRAQNNRGRALIERFVTQGYITGQDILNVEKLYPDEDSPRWQGRNPDPTETEQPIEKRQQNLQLELWYLSVAHAAQGIVDFLTFASQTVEKQKIPAGAVFFPDGNQIVGQTGFDSRLQAWDKFPRSLEWHAMSYAVCGNPNCIVDQVKRVKNLAPQGTKIIPALAGRWGKADSNRPPLEAQMQGIKAAVPQINSISHFAYSWQEPEIDSWRRSCTF
jgi:hypothetical protein